MTIGLEMTLPAAAGFWLNLFRIHHTSPVFVILGAMLGLFAAGMFHLLQFARQKEPQKPK